MENVKEFAFIINLGLLIATYFVLQPFKINIDNLTKALDTNSKVIGEIQKMFNVESVHLAQVDESVHSAHKRISDLAERIKDLEHRCIECNKD